MSTDKDLISRIMGRSNFGFTSRREAMSVGTNAKMSEYHAAVGLASLDVWDETCRANGVVTEAYRLAARKQ